MPCTAHTLQLVIGKGLLPAEVFVARAKQLIIFVLENRIEIVDEKQDRYVDDEEQVRYVDDEEQVRYVDNEDYENEAK
ncbi:14838_t:CDS:2 [Cetraspora pellucida]|uniref:14838_t:CDS:1 n=1 Tax=Cetraspora pellucida TaxID=1433469 RepID=A0ACA9P9G6_9GLOM|nr:14838_t:CDS:2 [Cetraspora pellucida]